MVALNAEVGQILGGVINKQLVKRNFEKQKAEMARNIAELFDRTTAWMNVFGRAPDTQKKIEKEIAELDPDISVLTPPAAFTISSSTDVNLRIVERINRKREDRTYGKAYAYDLVASDVKNDRGEELSPFRVATITPEIAFSDDRNLVVENRGAAKLREIVTLFEAVHFALHQK